MIIGLASNPFNYTPIWAIMGMNTNTHFFNRAEDDWPSGQISDYILKSVFLVEPLELKKYTKFIWIDKTGKKNPLNGSYDGGIGLVASSKADAYILPLDYHTIDGEVVNPSSFLYSVNYIAVQSIVDSPIAIGLSSLLELVLPPWDLLGAALGGVLMHLLVLYLLSLCVRKWLKKPKGPNMQTKILAFFFMLFIFFVDQFYNGNLSTDQIAVDVSGLLHSEQQILNTDREPCFLDEDGELQLFKNAHKTTLAYKIFLKMNASNPCFLMEKNSQMGDLLNKHNFDKRFVLGVDSAPFMPKVVQIFARKDTFTNWNPIWQSPRAVILRKTLKKKLQSYFDSAIILMGEFGILKKAFRNFPFNPILGHHLLDSQGRDMFNSYDGLQSYIDAHSSIAPLAFPSLDYLFRILGFILGLLLVANMIHWTLVRLPPIREHFAWFASFHRICRHLRRRKISPSIPIN